PVMGVDQGAAGQRLSQLRPQAADVDVDGAVVVARLPTPDLGEELLAGHDPLRWLGEADQQLKLADGQAERAPVDKRCVLLWPDLQPSHARRACPAGGRVRLPRGEGLVNDL